MGRMIGAPVMSLQTGGELCRLSEPIINPYTLQVVAFYVVGPQLEANPSVLFTEDIRGFNNSQGAIVDSSDNIMSPVGLVRLQKVIDYDFHLDRILVVDDHGGKLGRVENYIMDDLNYVVQQLLVKPGFFRSFSVANLIVGRSQIVKVEPNRITVKAPTIRADERSTNVMDEARKVLNPDFDNPFRKHRPATNSDTR